MSARTVFMFSGQGSQYHQMGQQLFAEHSVFREWMRHLDAVAHRLAGRSVIEAVYGAGKSVSFDRTLLTHPAIFMVEYALAQCLIDEGVRPDVTLGASLGSFAAAVVAGHCDVEDAMAAVLSQAAALEAACPRGGMIAVLAEPSLYEEEFLRRRSEMAGVNFHSHFALAAAHGELDAIEAWLKQRGVAHQRLAVSFAFHSQWIDSARAHWRAPVPAPGGALLPLVCCARAATHGRLPDDFFWQAVRQPIRFDETVAHLEKQGPHRYIDLGPSGTLATFVKYGLPDTSRSTAHALLTPYGQDRKNLAALVGTRAQVDRPAALEQV